MLINSGTSPVKIFKQGNFHTRLSFVIMGSANLFNKQITKGLLFLLSQIIYTVFMLTAGVRWIAGLITLGTKEQGSVYDPEVGFNVTVAGDNSMLFMIYGVMAIIITAVFLIIYYANLKSAYAVQSVVLKGKNPPSAGSKVAFRRAVPFHYDECADFRHISLHGVAADIYDPDRFYQLRPSTSATGQFVRLGRSYQL